LRRQLEEIVDLERLLERSSASFSRWSSITRPTMPADDAGARCQRVERYLALLGDAQTGEHA
jgi:hypothetical protein